jgi:hypothetical protein
LIPRLELIQPKLGHLSPLVIRRYIGIADEEIGEIESKVKVEPGATPALALPGWAEVL